ncbi:MAG: long-chain fatty acid--CoA ligase [Armatimonadetes bacterium]|nr:long-chain fatty acid--CoA ligase [Armatimonadota bacterium]
MSVLSLPGMLRNSCERHREKPAMLHHEGGAFRPMSYRRLWEEIGRYAAALRSLGVESGDRVNIQSENCVQWALAFWGCQRLGAIVVPIYPTLPAEMSRHIVRDCGARIVLAGSPEQAAKVEPLDDVRAVLLKGPQDSLSATAESWEGPVPEEEVRPDEIAMIIYTSGTTGLPKGAMLRHDSFTILCRSIREALPIRDTDVFLSFLPMSHVYEAVAGQVLPISVGATIAYAQSLRSLASDMVEVRPTIMLCVPRVLEAMRDRIVEAATKAPPLRRRLFQMALRQGSLRAQGRPAPLAGVLDRLVGAKIRERTGGRIRFFVSGGAALPPAVAEFYAAFRLMVLQGYGLTETTAVVSVNHPDDNRPHTVGPPIPCNEVKIAEDGEILFRGPARMVGYYNMPEETAAAIDEEGWFHTGDLGRFEDGSLVITDRKKDLIVLGNGKNVAPQPIENRLRESPLIADAVVVGDGRDHIAALIVPDFHALRQRAGAAAAKLSDQELAESEAARTLIKAEVAKVNQELADYEKVKRHTILDHPFTIEGGELTPTMKVKRNVVRERYASLIDWMYG